MVTYLGPLCCGREEHCKQISLACVGSARSVWITLGLPQLTAACAFRVYPAQAPRCSARHCPKQALHFVHFPGLSYSSSGSQVLHKGTDMVGHVFCALPRFKQLRLPGSLQVHCPRWAVHLNHLPGPRCFVPQMRHESTISDVLCVSSGELISGCGPLGKCQLSTIPGRLG